MVFGNSSHLSFCLRIEDFVKSALVIVMSSGRHNRLPAPPRDDEIGYGKPLVCHSSLNRARHILNRSPSCPKMRTESKFRILEAL